MRWLTLKLDKTGGLTEALALATEAACTRFSSDAGLHVVYLSGH